MNTPTLKASNVDERQPLLDTSPSYSQLEPPTPERDIDSPLPVKKRDWRVTAIYIFLGILGAVLLGVFIKGFLDADDVEVRNMGVLGSRLMLTLLTKFDLKKALKEALGGGLSGAAGISGLLSKPYAWTESSTQQWCFKF